MTVKVTAQMVKELREKTGAGMMDCKKALTAVNGDLEAAIDFLREKGLSSSARKQTVSLQKVQHLFLLMEMKQSLSK